MRSDVVGSMVFTDLRRVVAPLPVQCRHDSKLQSFLCGKGFVVACIAPVSENSMCSCGTAERVVTGEHSGHIHSHGYSYRRGLCGLLSMTFERWISVQ